MKHETKDKDLAEEEKQEAATAGKQVNRKRKDTTETQPESKKAAKSKASRKK